MPSPATHTHPSRGLRRLADILRQFPWIGPRSVITDTRAWLAAGGSAPDSHAGLRTGSVTEIFEGGSSVHPAPAELPAEALSQFREISVRRHPPAALFHLKGAVLCGDQGLVCTPDNRALGEFCHAFGTAPLKRSIRKAGRFVSLRPERCDVQVALLAAPQGTNHYHWLNDVLPRVRLLESVRSVTELYAVPEGINALQLETLSLLGIPREKLLFLGRGRRLRCQHLHLPSLPGSEGCSPPWAREFVRAALSPAAAKVAGRGTHVFIRRGPAAQRPVLNEDALATRLRARGFAPVSLEQLSLTEQIACFRDARVVVGAHGAGLANLLFSEHVALLELFSAQYLRPDCYFTLCRQAGFPYECLISPRVEGQAPASAWGAMNVDLDAMERRLDRLETQRTA